MNRESQNFQVHDSLTAVELLTQMELATAQGYLTVAVTQDKFDFYTLVVRKSWPSTTFIPFVAPNPWATGPLYPNTTPTPFGPTIINTPGNTAVGPGPFIDTSTTSGHA